MTIFGAGGGGSGKGKGGGGGGGRSEAKDNLDSTSYAKIVELLSEGEIEGFATPSRLGLTKGTTAYDNASLKDMLFDNTPILNPAANNTAPVATDFNFKGVTVATRFGTQAQEYVPGFEAIENEVNVGADVLKATPVVRSITDTDVDAVRVTIDVPSLQLINDNGDIVGSSISLEIAVQYNGGGYTTVVSDSIVGRTGDLYQRDYVINFTGAFPVDIKVTRVTNDSTSPKLSNLFRWSSYTELIYEKLRYPNSAYVALRVDAEQFSRIPSRAYRIRGIKVAIPSNATVDNNTGRLIYSGVWNGTFGAAKWCSDPAWVLYDLLTSSRYGLGDHIKATNLDKWAFYRASQYCSELVSTGLNSPSTEPRFSCNVNIQTADEAYKLINDLCSVFRAMPFWGIGSITVAQDRASDPIALFSPSNVVDGLFTYAGSSLKTRPTVVVVAWFNMDLRDVDREVVEDADLIAKYGVVTREIDAFACTSRAQAHRLGEWILYSERYESEVVSFVTGLENGLILRPGSIISIADPVKSGQRRAGRINTATASGITVDDIGNVTGGTLSVLLSNGLVESRSISSIAGNVITVSPSFSSAPRSSSMWLSDGDSVAPTQWRVLNVQEQEGINCAVNAIAYNPGKYDFIERGAALEEKTISALNTPPPPPSSLSTEEVLYELTGRIVIKLLLTWQPARGVNEYGVRWRGNSTNWTEVRVYGPTYEIVDVFPGSYEIEVYSVGPTKTLFSSPVTTTTSVTGLVATSIPYSSTVDLDMLELNGQLRSIAMNGDLTLTTSNRGNGRSVALRLLPGSSPRMVTFPADWMFVSAKPASIAANKDALLSLAFFGGNNSDGVATYSMDTVTLLADVFSITVRPNNVALIYLYFDFWNPSTSSWMLAGLTWDADVEAFDFDGDPLNANYLAFAVDDVPLVFASFFAVPECQLDRPSDPCDYAVQAFVDAAAYRQAFPSEDTVRLRLTGWWYDPTPPPTPPASTNITITTEAFTGGTRQQDDDAIIPYPTQPRLSIANPDTTWTNIGGGFTFSGSIPAFGDPPPPIVPGFITYIDINLNDTTVVFAQT